MNWLDKIIKDAEPGEKAPFRAFRLPRLGPYLWDGQTVRTLCGACWAGSGRIIALTFQWCRGAAPGDRLLRACAPLGALAGAGWVVTQQPLAGAGIAAAWMGAAVFFAGGEAWTDLEAGEPEPLEDAPSATAEDLLERDRLALLVILEEATRHRNGVHLGELHQEVAAHPLFAGLPRVHMGTLLEAMSVPVQRTLSVDGVEGRSGVRRADVEALLLALPREGQDAPSQPSESGSDQQESQPLSGRSQAALGPLSGVL